MAGFPLMNIGTGLTGFMGGFQQAQQAAQQRQMNQILMAMRQRALEQDQQKEQAQANAFSALLSLRDQQPIQQTMVPPMPGQGSTPQQPVSLPGGAPATPISPVADTGFDPMPSPGVLPPPAPAPNAMGEGTLEGLPDVAPGGAAASQPPTPTYPPGSPGARYNEAAAPLPTPRAAVPFYQSDPGYMGLGSDIEPTPAATSSGGAGWDQTVAFYVNKGLPVHVAQGIADVVGAESAGFQPTVQNYQGSGATGLYQDLGPRKTRLLSLANWENPQVQHENAWQEMHGGDPQATQAFPLIANAPTREAARNAFGQYFERSGAQYGPWKGGPSRGGGGDTLVAGGGATTGFQRVADQGGGQDFGSQLPPEQQSRRTAISVMSQAPGAAWGRTSIQTLAQAIEQANPGASPAVKFMALQEASKLLAPEEKMQMQALLQQNRQELQMMLQQERLENQRQLLAQREDFARQQQGEKGDKTGWVVQDMEIDGKKVPVRVQPSTGRVERVQLPEGATGLTRQGTASQSAPEPATVDFTAKAIANYQMAPMTGWAMRSPFGQQVMAKVMQINPEYQATQFAARTSAARAFTTGRQADAVRSFSVAVDHLSTIEELGQALANNDVQLLNRAQNRIRQELGYEGPVDFNFAKAIVGDEVSKAIIGGVGSVTDRQQLQAGFDAANSPEQLNGVIKTAKKLIAGQLGGYKRQYTRGTGQPDFESLLSPNAQKELQGLAGGEQPGGATYSVGQIIEKGGKRYRVTGGDPSDPDVEEVK